MDLFSREELGVFLRAVDRHLHEPFSLLIIGGTAAALAVAVPSYTKDIDVMGNVTALEEACRAARLETGLNIPLGPVGVEDHPENMMERLLLVEISGLTHLIIHVPERHDLVLMKMMRGQQNDVDTALEIHGYQPLLFEELCGRFKNEMGHVHGDPGRIRDNFAALIESLYGEAAVRRALAAVKKS